MAIVTSRFYTALCQNPRCRIKLGGLHIPCMGGAAYLACFKCAHVSLFRVEAEGIVGELYDRHGNQLDPSSMRRIDAAPAGGIAAPARS